ncbi:MAG: PadR family transcriptional regulator [Acidimicrobiales bacterium]
MVVAGGSWLSQLRRGAIEYCVLALLRDGERYGYELVRTLAQADGLVTSEGTIYPLLARLQRRGLVASRQRPSDQGPPRRYYRLTDQGGSDLCAFVGDWVRFRETVDRLVIQGGRT